MQSKAILVQFEAISQQFKAVLMQFKTILMQFKAILMQFKAILIQFVSNSDSQFAALPSLKEINPFFLHISARCASMIVLNSA